MSNQERPPVGTRVAGRAVLVRVNDAETALDWRHAWTLASSLLMSAVMARHQDMDSPCFTDRGDRTDHAWTLTEDNYQRGWSTHIDGTTITAVSDGSMDWSENGDGTYLECSRCSATCEVPDDYEVNYV